jgi:zinc protease
MTLGRRTPHALLVAFAILGAWIGSPRVLPAVAAQGPAASAALTATIPVDPLITTGALPNGLRYYVRANEQPDNRAALRLVVNAGSVLEDDDQLGLAHFVEHMAFNGTERFPKQEIVTFMESIGMRFGPSVNAFTSFDETVYMLQVPTDRPEAMDKAFMILEDWAQRLSFVPEEIDRERGVVIEEWRSRRGAAARMQDKQLPVLLAGSRYADRLPIGKVEVLQNFKHERLKQFYADWYRPDLMAVIAVGDFDSAAAIVKKIQTQFAALRSPASPRPRPAHSVPDRPGTDFTIATDPEASGTSVSVYHTMPARDQTTVGAYRRQIVDGLFGGMLSARFSELAQQADPPFLGAGAQHGLFVRTTETSILSASVRDEGIARGLEALFTENERVARFGFTQTELDRRKTALLRQMEQAVAEKDKQESSRYAAEYTRAFTEREPIPGIVYEHDLYRRFLPTITLEEVNALARTWSPDRSRVVAVSAPEKPGLTVPDAKALAAVINGVEKKAITAYVDRVPTRPLLETPPEPGRITSTSTRESHGLTEWQLSNGVRVVLKPTNFKQDEILMRAFSPGGHSLVPDADFIPASTAAQAVSAGGVGEFSSIDLRRVLTGKVAGVGVSIDSTTEGLSGSGSIKDLETLFQLVYLRFTAPRADPTVFQAMTAQARAALANQEAQPSFAFERAIVEARYGKPPIRKLPMTVAMVDEMNLEESMAFYRDRFADASDCTFVFVGSFDLPTIRPLVERYLGGLPSKGRKETWKDVEPATQRGVIERRVAKGIEPQSETLILFSGPFEYTQPRRVQIRAMAMVLQTRLRETLREDLGGTYSVGVGAGYTKIPRQEYTLNIGYGSSPDRADALYARVIEEIERLRKTPPADQVVNDVREVLLREHETAVRENEFFVRELAVRYQLGEDLDELNRLTEYYRGVTPASIQQAAQQYFDMANRIRVTLVPEK